MIDQNKNHKQEAFDAIKKQGLVPLDVLEKMTFQEMLKHLLMYHTTGLIWYPGSEVIS